AAGIAGSSNLFEQSHARQLRIGLETRPDDWLVGTELRRYRRPWPIPDDIAVQVPVQLSIPDPAMNRIPADSQSLRQGCDTHALLHVVPQQHPLLPSDHRASAGSGDAKVMRSPAGGDKTPQPVSTRCRRLSDF